MNLLLNKWYKNHALVYKILLFLVTTLFIVYLFPKTGKFRYSFEKGKPWQSENLYAPFNFAIKKSQEEIEKEQTELRKISPIFFEIDPAVKENVTNKYLENYNKVFSDTLFIGYRNTNLYKSGKNLIDRLYNNGVLDTEYSYDKERPVNLVFENEIQKELVFNDLFKISGLRPTLEIHFGSDISVNDKNKMISLFFDIIQPNVKLNTILTDKALEEELQKVSPTRGSIDKDQLIISKGQVIEDEQFVILNSLKSEYESQVWNTANYNWVLFAYTLLVALALLMLLLFLRKYRIEVFKNNTKVTFIFFNIALMVLLNTLIINYNSQYILVAKEYHSA